MADVQHAQIQHANVHEPKWITIAQTTDAGKVITPSSATPGVSVLRQLGTADLTDGAGLSTKAGVETLSNKRIAVRASSVAYAATLTPNADNLDLFACPSVTGALTIAAPTGTPTDGQELRIRLTQDATGGRAVTFNAAFKPLTAVSTVASKTTIWTFVYNAALTVWQEAAATAGT